ncbi:MAG TPA: FecR domain-containing protein [Vicinamibacterales bacterium]|nr:FecR domain-containing protein [Vicinamibacterales bacterium]
MTMPRSSVALVVLLLVATAPVAAQDGSAKGAGRVKVTSGAAFIVRDGRTVPATLEQVVFEADVLRTGADGRLGITLHDDTRVSLGPASEVRLDRFSFASAEGGMQLVLNFMRGVAAYVSGRIAKLSPDAIRLETPAAIVGVRGTTLAIRVDPE